jgi:hypothetical protein
LNLEELEKCFEGLVIKEKYKKKNTIFYLLSYSNIEMNIKVEISTRKYPDKYYNIELFGINILSLDKEYILGHKLCAVLDRSKIANRDLFELYFMLNNQWVVSEEIVQLRTGLTLVEYYKKLLKVLLSYPNKDILNGLGEVLDESQKDWVKAKLLQSLITELEIRI